MKRVREREHTIIVPAKEWWWCEAMLHRHQTEAAAAACEEKRWIRVHGIIRVRHEDGTMTWTTPAERDKQ